MANGKWYAVKTRFVFEGSFFVNAQNAAQARKYVKEHCGLVLGRDIFSTLPEGIVNWDFIMHPEKLIERVTPMQVRNGQGEPQYG
jgi:hypothetical protein